MSKQNNGCSGCLKYLLFIIIGIFVCAGIADMGLGGSGGSSGGSSGGGSVTSTTSTTGGGTTSTVPTPVPVPAGGSYYEQLNGTERMIYDGLLEKVAEGGLSCTFTDVDYDTCVDLVNRAVIALTNDHPEYFWLNSGSLTSGQYRPGTNRDIMTVDLYCYAYWTYTMSPDNYRNTLERKVEAVAAQARAYDNPFEQIKYVHDYLVQNTIYDYDDLEEAKKTHHVAASEYIYSAYGCLINGRAVCAGYAKAFQLILEELGIECIYVVGDGGGPHAWNCVTIDGQTYFMDVTWDDKDRVDDKGNLAYPNDAEYPYFCITSEQLEREHTVDESLFDIPDCTAEEYNYFAYCDLLLEDYNRSDFADAVAAQQGQKIISVQFTSAGELQDACADLIDANNWAQIPSLSSRPSITYYIDDTMLVLTFLL